MFKLILFGVGLSMQAVYGIAGIMDKDFKKRLQERDLAIVMKTRDGKTAVTYLLRGGKFSSVARDTQDPDMCVTLSSARDVFRSVLHLSPKRMVKSLVGLIRDGKLKIEFKLASFVWFSQTLTQMLTVFSDRSKPKKFLFINA